METERTLMKQNNMKDIRVRFAPSPTGIPHVGNIRTAMFDYFFAKSSGGTFILRIEDTDQARKIEGAENAIKESLNWLGVAWDEYATQSERLDEYKTRAEDLVVKGLAVNEEGAIRFTTPKDGFTSWVDAVGNKKIEFKNSDIENFIILKKDGFPTYHLANVIDDHLMDITHVIRGEDWIPSTPKHFMLYKAFGWEPPVFAHVPNVLGSDHSKLSKRRGAKSVLDFKTEGILPEALLNYLMLLGWSPKNDREILSKVEIEKEFKLENINVAPAVFDEKKLLWMNGVYIRESQDLKERLMDFYKDDGELSEFMENAQILDLTKTRMTTLLDFKTLVTKIEVDNSNNSEVIKELIESLNKLTEGEWTKDRIFEVFKEILAKHNIKMPVLYKIFTGSDHGLPLPDFLEALGKEDSLKRI